MKRMKEKLMDMIGLVQMTEKALDTIGLVRMTNRDQLIDELAALDGEALYTQLADNRLTQRIDDLKCEDCHRLHGGMCPAPGNDDVCALTPGDWLELPFERERLLETEP